MERSDTELSALRALAQFVIELVEDLHREPTHDGDSYQYPLNSDDVQSLRALVGAVERAQAGRE